jgi:hypothetical protein
MTDLRSKTVEISKGVQKLENQLDEFDLEKNDKKLVNNLKAHKI